MVIWAMFIDFDNNFGGGGSELPKFIIQMYKALDLRACVALTREMNNHASYVAMPRIGDDIHLNSFDPLTHPLPPECALVDVFARSDRLEIKYEFVASYGYGMPIKYEIALDLIKRRTQCSNPETLDIAFPRHTDYFMSGDGGLFYSTDSIDYIFRPFPYDREIIWPHQREQTVRPHLRHG